MGIDRTVDLHSRSKTNIDEDSSCDETGEVPAQAESFFDSINRNKVSLSELQDITQQIERYQSKILTSVSYEDTTVYSEALSGCYDDARLLAQQIRTELGSLKVAVQQQPKSRRAQCTALGLLTKAFLTQMAAVELLQQTYKNRCSAILVRQCRLVWPQTNSSDIEMLCSSENAQSFVEQSQALFVAAHETDMKSALLELQERHDEVIILERKIQDIHSIIIDVATLVQSQKELVATIQENIVEMDEYVEAGYEQTTQAVEKKKKCQQRKYLCSVFIVFVFGILVMILVLVLR